MKSGDVIPKPWGSEHIVDLNDGYCVKYLRIRRGRRLSKQYHERKRETMLLTWTWRCIPSPYRDSHSRCAMLALSAWFSNGRPAVRAAAHLAASSRSAR